MGKFELSNYMNLEVVTTDLDLNFISVELK